MFKPIFGKFTKGKLGFGPPVMSKEEIENVKKGHIYTTQEKAEKRANTLNKKENTTKWSVMPVRGENKKKYFIVGKRGR